MQPTIPAQLEELARLRRQQPAVILAEALEVGLTSLYRESVLTLYLHKRLPRRKAVRLLGIEAVRVAEQQDRATQQDLAWGLRDG